MSAPFANQPSVLANQPNPDIYGAGNQLFPYRPGYNPPDRRVDPEHHFPLTAPAVKVEGSVVERAHAAFENAATQFEKHLATVNMEIYTDEGARQRINEFTRTDAAKAVDAELDNVRQRRDDAAARIEHLKRELSPPGDPATELRNTRYWDRTVKMLDSIDDDTRLPDMANELIAKANRAELGVLLEELEPYMQARVQKFDSPRVRGQLIDGYRGAIEAATARAVPEYDKVKRQLTRAEQALTIATFNADSIRKQFALATPGAYRRPTFVDSRKYDPDA